MQRDNRKNWLLSALVILSFILPGILGLFSPSIEAKTGRPDYYGYSWEDEIPFFWEEINTTGTLIKATDWTNGPDDGYYGVGLPGTFDFEFYGTNYQGSNMYISTNGLLSFSTAGLTGSNSYWNRKIPYTDSPNRYIAPFWDNFEYVNGITQVFYETLGAAANQYFVVEFVNLINEYAGSPCTFEVILNETTDEIWFLYKDLPRNSYCRGYGATIGLEDNAGRGGILYSHNDEVLREEMAIHFRPNGISDSVSAKATSFAPPELWSGNYTWMLRLNFSVDDNAAQLYSLRLDQLGSAGVDNFTSVYLYRDANRNGLFDSEDEYLASKGLTDAGIDYVTFYGLDLQFTPLKPICLFAIVRIAETVSPGTTVQLSVTNPNYINLQGSIDDPVTGIFPLQSSISILVDNPTDNVTVDKDPNVMPPATISCGNEYVFCKLNFTINANYTELDTILVNQTGTATHLEVNWISAWNDLNGNGVVDSDEPQVGSGTFNSSRSAIINFWSNFEIRSSKPSYVLLRIQLSPAIDGKTVQLKIDSYDKITLEGNDKMNNLNFPITTSVATVNNNNVIHVTVDSNPASLSSLRAGQRDAPLLKVNFSVDSGSVMVFNIAVDKNNTGLFSDPDMPYQRLYRDVNDNGLVDEGIDELLCECNSLGIMCWFMPFGAPWVISVNDPFVLLFTVDISESAPIGGGSGTGINITFSNYIGYNPWTYAFDCLFPIESEIYPISAGTFDTLEVSGDDLMPATVLAGDEVVVERLNLTASSNEVALWSISITLNGTATNADVQWVEIYYDYNKDGRISPSVDTLLGSGMFDLKNNVTIMLLSMGVPFVVKNGVNKSLLIVYAISNTPLVGATAGLHINSSFNFSLEGFNDMVNLSGFPIDSSLATIIYQDTLICAKDMRVNPTTVEEGEREVLIMKLNLSTNSGSITTGGLRIGLLGTISYLDVGNIYAVEDVNENAKFDRNIDRVIGMSSFNMLGWSYIDLTFQGPFVVYSGINRSLLIGIDIEFSGYGKTFGLDIGIGNVTVDTPDNVSSANFPIQSSMMTVVGAAHNTVIITPKDLAPVNVYQAQESVEMLKLIIGVDDGNANIIRIKIGFNGTGYFQNISNAYLYWDVNKNDIIDAMDKLLDRNTFYMGRIYFRIDDGFKINASAEEHLIITYDIAFDAKVGTTVGVLIENENNITLECANDTVAIFNDYNSTNSLIQKAIVDNLTVTWTDIAPTVVYENDIKIELLRLTLSADSGDIYLKTITINLTGSASDFDINWVTIIHDVNNNGKYDIGLDYNLAGGWFSSKTTEISFWDPLKINASKPEAILIATDIAWDAGGLNFSFEIENVKYIEVKAPDNVLDLNFPIRTKLIDIIEETSDNITVQSTNLAPVKAYPGDSAVPMLALNIFVDAHNSYLQNFQVYMDGTVSDSDVNVVDVYLDTDSNGDLDTGIDRVVGSGTFFMGEAFCGLFDTMRITPTEPVFLILAYQVRASAQAGRFMGVNITSNANILVSWGDTVLSDGFPHHSSLTLIDNPTIDNLTVAGYSKIPTELDPGDSEVVVLQLNLTMDQNKGNVKTITINKLGSADDSDVSSVYIYDDVNDNGILDTGVDDLLGQGAFVNSNSTIQLYIPPSLGYEVNTSTTHLLVVYDISISAGTGVTVGAQVIDNNSVLMEGIDRVENSNMPIKSKLSTITTTPPDILNVTGDAITTGYVTTGDTNIDMLYFELNVSGPGSVKVTLIKLKFEGSLDESYLTNVRLYEDANGNNQYDSGLDNLVGSGTTFSGGTAFWSLAYTVTAGNPKTLIVVLDLSSSAPDGKTFNVSLEDSSYVKLELPDSVNPFYKIHSDTLTGLWPASEITVTGTSVIPVSIQQGTNDILVEKLTLDCDINSAEVTSITLGRSGSLGDTFITELLLFDDSNDDGGVDGGDALLAKGTFLAASLTFSPLSYSLTSGTTERLLIVMNISSIAPVGSTVRITLNSNTTVKLIGRDYVSSANFPIQSGQASIMDMPDTVIVTGMDKVMGGAIAGDLDVLLYELIFTVPSDEVQVTEISIGLTGSASSSSSDIKEVELYHDVNENGEYDSGSDSLLDGKPYSSSVTFSFSKTVSSGNPIHILIAIDTSIDAVNGVTTKLDLKSEDNITISGVDTVSSANFPLFSSELSIKEPIDILEVEWYDSAPVNLEANQVDILMLNMTLSAQSNWITVESLKFVQIGTSGWNNIAKSHLYKDEDGDGSYYDAVDSELDTVILTSDVIEFTFSELVFSGTPLKLLITIDINTSVEIGKDLGLKLNSNNDVMVAFPDTVSYANLPVVSALANLFGDSTPPMVSSLTLSDPSPTKAGSVTFTIEFNEDMNQASPPLVTFGIISPFNAYALTSLGWADSQHWMGSYIIDVTTGEGLNRISISNAQDEMGNTMLLDNTYTFIIDTTAPLVNAGSDITVDEGTKVDFDGSGCSDINGVESYDWTFNYDGSQQALIGVSPNFTFTKPGDYKVTLTVIDLAGNRGNDTMWVHVNEVVIVVPKRPRIISTTPSQGSVDVPVDDPVLFRFSLAMSITSVEKVIDITPMVSYDLSWGDSNKLLRLDFSDNLAYDTNYTITIGVAEATLGTTLEDAPFELKFTTEEGYVTPPPKPKITVDPASIEDEIGTGESITITGTSEGLLAGTEILIKLGDKTVTTTVEEDGKWSVTLDAPDTEGTYPLEVVAGDQTYSTELIVEPSSDGDKGDDKDNGTEGAGAAIAFIVVLIIVIIVILVFLMLKKKKAAKADDDDDEAEDDDSEHENNLKKKLNQLPVQSRKPLKPRLVKGPKKN